MGAVDAQAALEFVEKRAEAAELKRWIHIAADGPSSQEVDSASFTKITAALHYTVSRTNDRRWDPGTVAAASAAACLAVQGLCVALGELQAAAIGARKGDLLGLLCKMKEAAGQRVLQGRNLLPALDSVASGLSAQLFTGGKAEVDSGEAFVFDKEGRLRLPRTLLAMVEGCSAAGDLGAACYLLCAAHTRHATAGGGYSLQPIAEAVCAALGSAQGAAWLESLAQAALPGSNCTSLPKLFFAIRSHAGMERASRLLVQLHGHGAAWDATRLLASQLGKNEPGQLAACCATVPGLRAALHAMRERLVAEMAAGPPRPPPRPNSGCALPMPEELLAVLPGCWLFAPIKAVVILHVQAFLGGDAEQAFIRYDGPEAAGQDCEVIIDRLTSEWARCFRLKPQLEHHLRWRPLRIPLQEKRGKKKTTRKVAGIQLNKVDDWYCKKLLPAFQSARREAQQLQAVLDTVQQEDAAPACAAPVVAAEAASEAEPHADAGAGAEAAAERPAEAAVTEVQAAEAEASVAMDVEVALAETEAAAVDMSAAAVAVATEPEPVSAATEQRTVSLSAVEDLAAGVPASGASVPAVAAQEPAPEVGAPASPPSCSLAGGTGEEPAEPAQRVAAAQAAGCLQGTAAAAAAAAASAAVAVALASPSRPAQTSVSGCSLQHLARPGRRASAQAPLAAPLAATPIRTAADQVDEEALPAQVEEAAAPAAAAQLLQAEPAASQPAARRASMTPRPAANAATCSTQPASQQTASTRCTQGSAWSGRLPIRSLSGMLKDWKSKGSAPGGTPSKRQTPGSSAAKGGPGSRNRARHAKIAVKLNLRTLPEIWGWFQPDPRRLRLDFQEEAPAEREGAGDSDTASALAHAFAGAADPVQRTLLAAADTVAEAAGPSSKRSRR